MKKTTFVAVLAFAVAVCACKHDEPVGPVIPDDGKKEIKASVKAPVMPDGCNISAAWEEGASFFAIQNDTTVVRFDLIEGAGTTEGVFKTRAKDVCDTTKWKAILGKSAQIEEDSVACSFMNQTGSLEKILDYNYVVTTAVGSEPEFDFEAGAKITHILEVTLPAGVKCIEYNPCAWYKVTPSETITELYAEGAPGDKNKELTYAAFSAENTSTITLDNISSSGDKVYIAVPTLNCNLNYESYNSSKQYGNLRTGFILTFLNNDSDNADKSNGIVLGGDKNQEFNLEGKGGLIGEVDCSALSLINRPKPADAIKITSGKTATLKADNTTSVMSTSRESVNSLETYWAPFNVGASSATEPGYFVGYGELNERLAGDFVSYTLRQKGSDGSNRPAIICYFHSPFAGEGSTTFYSLAGNRYDIAHVKWGVAWRMPYLIECWTLWRDHLSEMSEETVGGKKCLKVDAGNGSSLYIPCCGWYGDTANELKDPGYACIWTADKNQRSASNAGWDQAYAMQFTSTTQSDAFCDRYGMHRSLNVRPVLASSVLE